MSKNIAQDFLVEIGTEELPPKALLNLINAFESGVKDGLEKAQIPFTQITSFATPRRLALLIQDLAPQAQDQKISKRGPAVSAGLDPAGNPSKALLGFLQSVNTDLNSLGREKTDKGEYFLYEGTQTGQSIEILLPPILKNSLDKLPIPKVMRWGSSDITFVRPVQWIVMLYGSEILPGNLLGLTAGRITRGHRFHHPEPITLQAAHTYEAQLLQSQVITNYSERSENIKNQVNQIAQKHQAIALLPQDLLEEITSINEWPHALLCQFDPEFLTTPQEALISALQQHQKCIALVNLDKNKNQKLLPCFIAIANLDSQDPQKVISGNEKVVRARLSDARFFYQTDLKTPLDQHEDALAKLTYQAKLGSMLDKQKRLSKLASEIAKKLGSNPLLAERSGLISKADLVSNMVMEFPELQGLMGEYYAQAMGENPEVCLSLKEQYFPRFSGDQLPSCLTGMALSLAEKLDALVGIFGIGEKPSGSKDPFALRRQAIGLIRILIEKKLNLNLLDLINFSQNLYGNLLSNPNTQKDVQEFILERLKNYLIETGINPNLFEAVKSVSPSTLTDFDLRIKAVMDFLKLPEAASLAAASKRVKNLLSKSEGSHGSVNPALLKDPAEKELFQALIQAQKLADPKLKNQNYSEYLQILSSLKNPIDQFFDQIMVLCEESDLRKNRLALLNQVSQAFSQVAEIGCLA